MYYQGAYPVEPIVQPVVLYEDKVFAPSVCVETEKGTLPPCAGQWARRPDGRWCCVGETSGLADSQDTLPLGKIVLAFGAVAGMLYVTMNLGKPATRRSRQRSTS